MKRLSPLALSSALIVLGGACTDCGEPPGSDAGPTLGLTDAEVTELCVLYTVGYNHTFEYMLQPFTACSAEERFTEYDEETLAAIADECVPGVFHYDIFDIARRGGRVDIDIERTRACADKGRGARATTSLLEHGAGEGDVWPLFDDDDCQGAITGLVDEGGACEQHWDCVEGLACEADPPDAATLRCLAPAQDGERCGGSRSCDVDLTCTADETCAPSIAEGADCVNDPLGGRECVEGAFCDADDTGLCQPLGGESDACGSDLQCAEGLFCAGADPDTQPPTAGTCAPVPPTIDDGEPCDPDVDTCAALCSVCRPQAEGGATVCLDRGGDGAYCEDDAHCRNGFGCDPAASVCAALPVVELPGLGESCDVNEGCDEGFCVSATCVAGEPGDPCDAQTLECAGDNICVVVAGAGTCTAAPVAGEACIEEMCAAGAFCNASGQCEELRGAGASCDVDEDGLECLSGTCLKEGACAAPGPSCDESREWFLQFVLLGFVLPVVVRVRRRRRGR